MVLVQNYALAVFLCFVAMICWGSWQNTQNLIGKEWRFELYYWDYTIGIILFALLMAFTFGSFGSQGRSFIPDLAQADARKISFLQLLADSSGTSEHSFLLPQFPLPECRSLFPSVAGSAGFWGYLINYHGKTRRKSMVAVWRNRSDYYCNSAQYAIVQEARQPSEKASLQGIMLSLLAGLCIAFFYRFVASSLATDFSPADAGKISSYTAVVFFSLGAMSAQLL